MGSKTTERDRVGIWNRRVAASTRDYEKWAEKWSCELLEQAYYGDQWQGDDDEWSKRKYVINLFYPSINISKPSLLFNLPKYSVKPRLTRLDDPASDTAARCKLQEDTLNTFVQDPDLGYAIETGLALLDGQFRFGMVQVGYTADFIDNPNAGKPILKDGFIDQMDETTGESVKIAGKVPMTGEDGAPVLEANATIDNERLYLKWIDAKNCRFPQVSKNRLKSNDWVGYCEWRYIEDLKANPRYKNTSKLTSTGRLKTGSERPDPDMPHEGMVKVWFIWDLRAKQKRIFPEGGEKFFLEESFKFLPLAGLKFDEILGQWLPLPLTYNWMHPQNELNDSRETDRIHRQRAKRRYVRKDGAMSEDEWTKLVEGDDMVCAVVTGDITTAIFPVPDAPLDASFSRAIPQAVEDFIRVSGISGESQQIADSDTATQANLIALAGRVREAARRLQVAMWLSEIGRLILLTIKENMALPFWIKMHVDPYSDMAQQEALEVAKLWKQIVSEDLGDIDNEISVEMTSMSPVAQEQERTNWLTFLTLVTNPQLGAILASSPTLLRKTAGLFDIHSEKEIAEVSQAMQAAALMFAQQQQMEQQAKGGGAAPGPVPDNAAIGGQLAEQLPVEMSQGVQ